MRKEAAIPILNAIIEDVDDEKVSTHSLLLKSLEAAELLDVSSTDKGWITQELTGYENQNEASTIELPPLNRVPHYRWVELPTKLDVVGRLKTVYMASRFAVCFPCEFLEDTTSSMSLHTSLVFKPSNLWERFWNGTIVVSAHAELPANRIKSIVKSIRGFVYRFAVSTLIANQFGESVSGIIDNTQKLVSSRLRIISEPLLELMNETLDSLHGKTEELHWRVVLENNRTILRRFTGLLLNDDMMTDVKPKEGDASKKAQLILTWCKEQLRGQKGTELESLRKEISILLDLINKSIHSEITGTSRGEAERILLKSFIWMAGMIEILDEVGYDWVPEFASPDIEGGEPG